MSQTTPLATLTDRAQPDTTGSGRLEELLEREVAVLGAGEVLRFVIGQDRWAAALSGIAPASLWEGGSAGATRRHLPVADRSGLRVPHRTK